MNNLTKVLTLSLFNIFINLDIYGQTWVQKASPPGGSGLDAPIYFSIGSELYVGGGWLGGYAINTFYQYTPATNSWVQKANTPGIIYSSCCFTLNGKGYVVCGATPYLTTTVYCYDPVTNSWQVKNNFPGSGRQNLIGFSVGGKGYLFGGFSGPVNTDLWQYNDTTDTWLQLASCPGPGRDGPTALVINNEIFVGMGADPGGVTIYSDFYKYDLASNSYTAVANIPIGREGPANFTIGNIGYIGIGYGATGPLNDFYEYNPTANSWTAINNFGRGGSWNVFCATVGNLPYVGCGISATGGYYIDTWTWAFCNLPVNLGGDTSLCRGSSLILRDTFSGALSLWSTGDTSPSITITHAGTYWLRVTQGSCIGSDTIVVAFDSLPPAFSLGSDTIYCGAFSRTLATGNDSTYWSTGSVGPQITVTAPGTYWASVRNGCGSSSDTISLLQSPPPPAFSLGSDTIYCGAFSRTLATGNDSTYWSTSAVGPQITVSAPGTYWAKVVNGCGSTADTIILLQNTLPSVNLGSDTTFCGAFSVSLATGSDSTYWSTGAVGPQIAVDTAGSYWARITNFCGSAADTIILSEKPLPVVYLGNDTNICNSNPLLLNAAVAGATYLWQDGSTAPTYTVTGSGTYRVSVDLNGCKASDSITVAYITGFTFSLGSDSSYCGPFSRVLSANVAGTIWSTGDTATSITVSSAGTYWGQTYACGENLRDSITLNDYPFPVVELGSDTSLCTGRNLLLNAGNPGATYHWQNDSSTQVLNAAWAGLYSVTVTMNGCSGSDSISISNLPLPSAFSLGPDTTICEDSSMVLNAFQNGVWYRWNTGDTSATIRVGQSGLYTVSDSNNCGSATALVQVQVLPCTCRIAIPNAFSPNGDGKNDYYHVLTECPLQNFEFSIYNRWGQLIFTTSNLSDWWDGKYRGLMQPIGVYVYFLHYTDPFTGIRHDQSGNVTLLR